MRLVAGREHLWESHVAAGDAIGCDLLEGVELSRAIADELEARMGHEALEAIAVQVVERVSKGLGVQGWRVGSAVDTLAGCWPHGVELQRIWRAYQQQEWSLPRKSKSAVEEIYQYIFDKLWDEHIDAANAPKQQVITINAPVPEQGHR